MSALVSPCICMTPDFQPLKTSFHQLRIQLQERRERHRQNYMHITIHTSQTWADTFISELNDTHVEAELRVRHIPPAVS